MQVAQIYAAMGIDFTKFNADERAARARSQGLGSTLGGIIKNAFSFGLGQGFFQLVQSGFRASVGAAVSFNSTMEQANIGFTTMLGSAEKARDFMADVEAFALRTPFDLAGLTDTSKRMMAFGFAADEILPTLQSVGDAVAALGSGQAGVEMITEHLGRMKTQGKVSAVNMMYLARAGVAGWKFLAEYMGKTIPEVKDMVTKGLVSAETGVAAVTEGMNKNFGGMMKKAEGTWAGVTAVLQELWQSTLGKMTTNLFTRTTQWLIKVKDFASGFHDALREGGIQYAIAETFGPGIASSVSILTSVLSGLWRTVVGVGRTIIQYWSIIGPLTMSVAWAFLTFKTISFVLLGVSKATSLLAIVTRVLSGEQIKTSMTSGLLAKAIQIYNLQLYYASNAAIVHAGALQVLRTAIYSVYIALGPLGLALIGISVLLGVGLSLWLKYDRAVQAAANAARNAALAKQQKDYKDYADSIKKAIAGTEGQADALGEMGKASKDNIQSFDEVHQVTEDLAGMDGMDEVVPEMPVMPEMPELDLGVTDYVAQAKEEMGGFWGWLSSSAAGIWSSIWTKVTDVTRSAWEPVAQFLGNAWEGIKSRAAEIWGSIAPVLGTIWDGILTAAQVAWALIQYALSFVWFAIVEIAKAVWGLIGPYLTSVWDSIKATAISIWTSVRDFFTTVWNSISKFLRSIWDSLVAQAKVIWSPIQTFFVGLWNGVWETFDEIWTALSALLAGIWEDIKAAAKSIWDSLQRIITDPIGSAKKDVENITAGIKTFFTGMWEKLLSTANAGKDLLYKYIVQPFKDAKEFVGTFVESAADWGKNLIDNFVNGIKKKVRDLKDSIVGIGETIKDFLGFSSPTKEGPGRYADQWAPNFVRMYAQGILSNVGVVQSAVGSMARSMVPMTAIPTPAFAGMSSSGWGMAGGSAQPIGGGYAPEIHLHIGTLVADDLGLKKLEQRLRDVRISEDQRIGGGQA